MSQTQPLYCRSMSKVQFKIIRFYCSPLLLYPPQLTFNISATLFELFRFETGLGDIIQHHAFSH